MSKSQPEYLREELGCLPSDLDLRLDEVYKDTFLHDKYTELEAASEENRPALEAQLDSYLAAAHVLFPEESRFVYGKIISDSLGSHNEG